MGVLDPIVILPHSKKFTKLWISLVSRVCWFILNIKRVAYPILVLDSKIATWKQLSPDANPATQLGSNFWGGSTIGLSTGIILGKSFFNWSERPLFRDALILTISPNFPLS